MTDMLISLDEQKLTRLQEIAESEQTTIEAIVIQVLDRYLEHHAESPLEYPDWLKGGLFAGGTEITGRDADNILAREWNPDRRD